MQSNRLSMLDQLNSNAFAFSLGLLAVIVIFSSSMLDNSTLNNYSTSAIAQPFIETVKYRDLVIDLGNGGLKTNAQLTLPAVGNGPFPGVLLVHGSGPVDMNETLSPDSKPFWQIAHYLSERGFVVLRYDKRGVGENGTILDTNVWGNATFDDLKNDAARALDVLIEQPEVDPNRITLVGHSEGTVIIPRLVIDLNNDNNNSAGNLTKIANIVLMGVGAQNLIDIMHFQVVDNPLLYAHQVLDKNRVDHFQYNNQLRFLHLVKLLPPTLAIVVLANTLTLKVNLGRYLKGLLKTSHQEIQKLDVLLLEFAQYGLDLTQN
jgi:pimeloyl-ACP methyl ester carboxylesterase